MIINLTENGFYLNGLKIENKQTELSDVVDLLGKAFRYISLKYGITLIIFDTEGVGLWMENDKITQLQAVLSAKKTGDRFPTDVYQGEVIINDKKQTFPINFEDVSESSRDFVWGDDSRQYGVNILYLMPKKSKIPFRFDEKANLVEYISS